MTFSAADFGVTGSGKAVDALNAALAYLDQSATAQDILSKIKSTVRIQLISATGLSGDFYNPPDDSYAKWIDGRAANTIYWDPFAAVLATNAQSPDVGPFSTKGMLSPALLLIHEAAHAYDVIVNGRATWNTQNEQNCENKPYANTLSVADFMKLQRMTNNSEAYAISKEVQVAKELAAFAPQGFGEIQRNNHITVYWPKVYNPTMHTLSNRSYQEELLSGQVTVTGGMYATQDNFPNVPLAAVYPKEVADLATSDGNVIAIKNDASTRYQVEIAKPTGSVPSQSDHLTVKGSNDDFTLENDLTATVTGGSDKFILGDGDKIVAKGSNEKFVYVQGTSVTIDNGSGDGSGSIWIGTPYSDGTPLTTSGITIACDPTSSNVWRNNNSEKYTFTPSSDPKKGTLTVSGGSLGAGNIVIENFNLAAALDTGYLGIHLGDRAVLQPRASVTMPTAITSTAEVKTGIGQVVTLNTLNGTTVQLSCPGSYRCETGADTYDFSQGPVTLSIPPGQNFVTFTLIDASGASTPDIANLSAVVTDNSGNTVTSNNLAVTFDQPGVATTTVTPDHSIYGNFAAVLDANGRYQYDAMGNLITDSGSPAPNTLSTSYGHINGSDLIGSTGNDLIVTGDGTVDSVDAQQGGNDTIQGGAGVDIISGGNGNNIITGGGEANVAADSQFHDALGAGNGNNEIYANTQVDLATALANQKSATATNQQGAFISVGDGANTIVGGNGNDLVFVGTGANTVVMGAGKNTFAGGVETNSVIDWWSASGNQILGVDAYTSGAAATGYKGNSWNSMPIADTTGGGIDQLHRYANTVTQGSASGTAFGVGNDTIYGGTGDSTYFLSNGNNWLDAGGGKDSIYSGTGSNTIYGGTGNDTIYGAGASDYISLESGSDLVILQGGNNTVIGGSGDNMIASGDPGMSDASMASEAGATNYIYGGTGQTTIVGSAGSDTLISGSESGGKSTAIYAGTGQEYIVGGNAGDSLYGGTGSNTIYAGDGNTTVRLNTNTAETSTVYGGTGNDTITGGAGTDVINAGDGNASITAGSGATTITGGLGDDTITGGSGDNVINAGDGNATITAGSGATTIHGGFGSDSITGGSGTDVIYVGDGTSTVTGGSGDTTFHVGGGDQTITGGSGSNTYIFDQTYGNVQLNLSGTSELDFGGVTPDSFTVSAAIGSDGQPALQLDDGSGGIITISGDPGSATFVFGGHTLTYDDLMQQATWGGAAQVDPSQMPQVEQQFAAGTQSSYAVGSGYSNMQSGSGATATNWQLQSGGTNSLLWPYNPTYGGWYKTATQDSAISLYYTSGSTTFTYDNGSGARTVTTPVNSWAFYGGNVSDTTLNLQQATVNATANDSTITVGSAENTTVTYGQAALAVAWTGSTTPYTQQYSQMQVSGYVYTDGSFGFTYQSGATATTGLLTSSTTSYVADVTLLGGSLANSLYTYGGSGLSSSGEGTTIPQHIPVNFTHYHNTYTTTTVNLADGSNHTVYDYNTDVVNAAAGNNTIYGSGGNGDLVYTGTGNNSIIGAGVVYEGSGNDTISSATMVYGGSGNASISNSGTVYAGSGNDTISNSTVVYGGTGNDTITGASTVYGGSGNEVIVNADATVIAGSGNETILGGSSASKGLNVYVNPNRVGNVLVGGLGTTSATYDILNTYYQSKGIPDWYYRYTSAGDYMTYQVPVILTGTMAADYIQRVYGITPQAAVQYGELSYVLNANDATNTAAKLGLTLQQAIDQGLLTDVSGQAGKGAIAYGSAVRPTGCYAVAAAILPEVSQSANSVGDGYLISSQVWWGQLAYDHVWDPSTTGVMVQGMYGLTTQQALDLGVTSPIAPLSDLVMVYGGTVQPSNYYAIAGVHPTQTLKANDYGALAPYSSILASDSPTTVTFGRGVSPSNLQLSWGRVVTSLTGSASDTQSLHTTLNLSWGSGKTVQVIIPNYSDPLGSGVLGFVFADGTKLSMADMIAMAPPAPTFDPEVGAFIFYPAMGAYTLTAGHAIQFAAGIDPSAVSVSQDAQGNFVLSYNNGATVLTIAAQDAIGMPVTATFADNTNWQFVNANGAPYNYLAGSGVVYLVNAANNGTVQFGSGITSDMITLGVGSCMLRIGNSGDVLHIEGFNPSDALNSGEIQTFKFADGTSLSYSQLLARGFDIYGTTGNETLTGTNLDNRIYAGTGNDVLIGSGAHDTLYGGAGNDTLTAGTGTDLLVAGSGGGAMIGGSGSDTFMLSLGGGQQTITDTLKATSDTVEFDSSVASRDARYTVQGSDLLISYGTQGDSVLIKGYVQAPGQMLFSQFQFADGNVSVAVNADGSYATAYTGVSGDTMTVAYSAAGAKLSDTWTKADGSHGSDTFNADGSSSGTAYPAAGGYSTYVNNGLGSITTTNFDSTGNELGYNTSVSDALGNTTVTNYDAVGNLLGSSVTANDGLGNVTTTNYDQNTVKLSDTWSKADGSFGSDTFNADGSYSVTVNDGMGDVTTTNYDAGHNKLSDSWAKADGSSGSDTFNTDGSYSVTVNDGYGNVTTTNYGAAKNKLSDTWAKSDGSHGNDAFPADGSKIGTIYNADGTYSTYVNDGHGNITTTNFDANGTETGYSLGVSDGLGNTKTNFYDASGAPLGSSAATDDGQGNITTTYFDVAGVKLRDTWVKADGSSGHDTFNADSSSISTVNDGAGDVTTTNYDASHVRLSDTWTKADGSSGSDTFNADGSYVATVNDGMGGVTTTNYDGNGHALSDTWAKADGSHGFDAFNAGASSGAAYNADGSYSTYANDGAGDVTTSYYDVVGRKLSDTWTKADGTYGNDTFNADGSSSGIGYKVNGSYTTYTNDGLGDTSTASFNFNGAELSDSWAKADGSHGTETFNAYDTVAQSVSYAGTGNDVLTATAPNDTLYGGAGNDTLMAGSGTDVLVAGTGGGAMMAGAGFDTFKINLGSGQQTIIEAPKSSGNFADNITFGTGITFANSTFKLQGGDLLITYGSQGDSTLIKNFVQLLSAAPFPFVIQYADGGLCYPSSFGIGVSLNFSDLHGGGGSIQFNADGSYATTSYSADGSYSNSQYSVDGSHTTSSYVASTGMTTTGNYYADGSNTVSIHNATWTYSDSEWRHADGSYGGTVIDYAAGTRVDSQHNADGSSSGANYNPDGTHSSFTNDGLGDIITNYYDVTGNLLYDTWVKADGTQGINRTFIGAATASGTVVEDYAPSTQTLAPSGANLVVNGGFETGDFSGWNLTGYAGYTYVDNSSPYAGNYAGSFGDVGQDNHLSQTIQTVAGQSYLVDFWLAGGGVGGVDFSSSWNGSTMVSLVDTSLPGYTEYQYQVTATSSASVLDFALRNDPNYWNLDNISVTPLTPVVSSSSTAVPATESAAGSISFSDVYQSDMHTVTVTPEGAGYVGNFTTQLVADSTATGTGSVQWAFTVDNSAIDYLAAGQILTQKYDVLINDGTGTPAMQTVTVDIVGVNDPAFTFQANMGAQTLSAGTTLIQFAAGIDPGAVSVTQDAQGNFVLSYNNGASTLTVPAQNAIAAPITGTYANGANWQFVNANGGSYTYNAGSGVVYLINAASNGTVQFGAGITSSMITLGVGSLMLRVGNGTGDMLHIEGFNPQDALNSGEIQNFTFTDGTSLTYAQLLARGFDIYGTTGSETLTGTNLDNRIYAGTGNDMLIGSGAHDTLYGGVGNDTLVAGSGADVLVAGTGGGSMIGGTGSDTFMLSLGDGQQTITDTLKAASDTIRFDSSVASTSASFSLQGNDLLVGYGNQGDSVLIKNYVQSTSQLLFSQFQFADGAVSVSVNPDGSYVTAFTSVNGETMTVDYSAGGAKLSDTWTKSDGSHGADTFNSDGSSSGTSYAANGNSSTYTNDGHGSTTTTNYNAATGETTGSVATAGAGYSYTYDNTVNANGVVGDTESKVNYTYADGSTYATDTVYDPNGSYQQSTLKGDGSTTTTDYNAATGETTGSVATAGAGYSYTYDNTVNVGGVAGVTESKVDYTYADGSTYATDTVYDPNGSYQQSTLKGDGSTTTTNYNAATGETTGSVTTAGAGYGYTYDNTVNVGGVAGVTESKVGYTYADGSTYATDTVYDPNGSYQQSTLKGDGSTTTTNYSAATGETTGSVATAGAGYGYTYDNTVNVGGVAGVTESKVDYTYADGSTYATDTVYDPNGSYQQSTLKGDGSTTTTNYNAATGETTGSVATAGAGYSYTYDNTVNVGGVAGVTESKVDYTYTDGSTYVTDTVYNPDHSYLQAWSKSDGTAGSVSVDGAGTLTGDSWVHADGSQGVDASGNQLIMGSASSTILTAGAGADVLIGGAGSHTLTTGAGNDIIAFNKGDGQDVVNAASGQNNTLSLGGNFAYSDLAFQKNGNDLVLDVGSSDAITLKDWYAGNNKVIDLQVIASAMSGFNPGSTDVLSNCNVENFDFANLVSQFDQACAANPSLTSWSLMNGLLNAHLSGSDTAALGGDLAYQYGMNGNLTGFNVVSAQGELSNSLFAAAPQTLSPWSTLNTGTAQIK